MGEDCPEKLGSGPEFISLGRIADMSDADRPREKLLRYGADALSSAELLAIFFNTGVVGMNVVEMSQRLLKRYSGSLQALSRATVSELMEQKGIGEAKAVHLAAAMALGKRLAHEKYREQAMDSPDAMADLLGPEMRALSKESLRVVLITTRLTLLRVEEVHLGSVNEVSAHVRDVLRPVITSDAFGFSVVHNHPSGNPEPSSADRVFTRKLKEVAELMQCRFLDHIIIGQSSEYAPKGYFSFREHGMLS